MDVLYYNNRIMLEEIKMGANYTEADIRRMERELQQLEMELKSRPDRASAIKNEISNLRYELNDAKRNVK